MRHFEAAAAPGFLLSPADEPRHARKREFEVRVRFAAEATELQTPEGRVHVQPGDAIVSDAPGRQWRVSRHHFDQKYRLLAEDRYCSRRIEVQAQQLDEPFEVLLSDRRSRLLGVPGDWLVDYGDGSLGVVSDTAFDASYDLID